MFSTQTIIAYALALILCIAALIINRKSDHPRSKYFAYAMTLLGLALILIGSQNRSTFEHFLFMGAGAVTVVICVIRIIKLGK